MYYSLDSNKFKVFQKFSIKDFSSKCDQILSFLWILLYLLKKYLIFTSRTPSERLMYFQFTFCVYGKILTPIKKKMFSYFIIHWKLDYYSFLSLEKIYELSSNQRCIQNPVKHVLSRLNFVKFNQQKI